MQEKEIWRDIKDYPNYKISNLGRVKSLSRKARNNKGFRNIKETILKNMLNNNGRYAVNLYEGGRISKKFVHQLVAIAFLNHVPSGHVMVIDHIDNNPLNNNVNNLQIITIRENNSKDRFRVNYTSKYIGVHWHKASNKWASDICTNYKKTHLGVFNSELEASVAYQKALSKLI